MGKKMKGPTTAITSVGTPRRRGAGKEKTRGIFLQMRRWLWGVRHRPKVELLAACEYDVIVAKNIVLHD